MTSACSSALADGKPRNSSAVSKETGIKERYIREWLSALAAADYLSYDEKTDRFHLTPEQAMVFAEEDSPAFFAGAFQVVQALWMDELARWPTPSVPGRAWDGTSIALACSGVRSASSGLVTTTIWLPTGFRHCRASEARLKAGESRRCRLRPRRFDDLDGPGIPSFEVLLASTITRRRSSGQRPRPRRPVFPTASRSNRLRRLAS